MAILSNDNHVNIQKKHIRKNEDWWRNQKVISKREICNSLGCLPSGTIFDITRKYQGLSIISRPCPHCGFQLHISRVKYYDLLLIERGQE